MKTATRLTTEWCPKCNHKIQYEGDAAFCLCVQPRPQETPAQGQQPILRPISSGVIEGPDGFTVQIENSKGAYQPEWLAFRDLIVRSVNQSRSFDSLVGALEGLLECGSCQNQCAPDDMTCATNVAREALRLARE